MQRIGIYAGTFNPVHAGHIGFALQATQAAQLDTVCFLPERQPRHKTGVEHYGHRVAMLNKALRPYDKFIVGELPDIQFSVKKTLPALEKTYANCQLVFLLGSDVVPHMHTWQYIERLLQSCELVIGLRAGDDETAIKQQLESLPIDPKSIYLLESYADDVSSTDVRKAIHAQSYTKGLLRSVQQYSNKHWLYVTVGTTSQ